MGRGGRDEAGAEAVGRAAAGIREAAETNGAAVVDLADLVDLTVRVGGGDEDGDRGGAVSSLALSR